MELERDLKFSEDLFTSRQCKTVPQTSIINAKHRHKNVQQGLIKRLVAVVCQRLCGVLVLWTIKGY